MHLFWVYSPDGSQRRVFPGWWEVLAGACHAYFGYGFYLYSWASIVAVMTKRFGWSATQLSVTTTLTKEESAIEGPIVGWLLDRYGPRYVAAGAWMMSASGYALLPALYFFGGNILWLYFCYAFLVVFGMNAGLYASSYMAANRWFIKNRAMALGSITMGGGFGYPLAIALTAFITVQYGWEAAVYFIGAMFLVVGAVVAMTLFRRYGPEYDGMYPDNEKPAAPVILAEGEVAKPKIALKDFTGRDALKMKSFWAWTLGSILGSLTLGILSQFQNLRMQEVGYTVEAAALYYALDFVFSGFGRLLCVVIQDYFHPRLGLAGAYIVQAFGYYCFAVASNQWWIWGFVVFHGFGYGYQIAASGPVPGALFGRERYATIRGLNGMITSIVALPLPIFFGMLKDAYGSYYMPFVYTAVLTFLAGVATLAATTPKGQIQPGRRAATVIS